MTPVSQDMDLLKTYSDEQSEEAFRALLERHLSLVYATALRLVNDAGTAEEIAQNVFIALARKAPGLRRDSTLAGWLYRTTLLEARQRIRADLRRKRREEIAIELGTTSVAEDAAWKAIAPLLDEALMQLRDADRLAVILRFFENRNLREIGKLLHISEDAAQKRTAKALEKLAGFFRRHGFAVPSGTVAAVLVHESSQAAPVGLTQGVVTAVSRSLALKPSLMAGAAASLVNLMTLTKTQTAAVCLVLAALPTAWQWKTTATEAERQTVLNRQIADQQAVLADLEKERDRFRRRLRYLESNLDRQSLANVARPGATAGQTDVALYRWSDESEYVRLPKSVWNSLRMPAITQNLKLDECLIVGLGLEPYQVRGVEASLARTGAETQALINSHTKVTDKHIWQVPPGSKTFGTETSAFPEEGGRVRERLESDLNGLIGTDRQKLLLDQLGPLARDSANDFGTMTKTIEAIWSPDNPDSLNKRTRYERDGQSHSSSDHGGPFDYMAKQFPEQFQPTLEAWRAEGREKKQRDQKGGQ